MKSALTSRLKRAVLISAVFGTVFSGFLPVRTLQATDAPASTSVDAGSFSNIPALTPTDRSLPDVIMSLVFNALAFVGVIAFLYFLYAGFLYLTSGAGDNTEAAKKMMTNAIIGMVIIFLSLAIVRFVITFLNNAASSK